MASLYFRIENDTDLHTLLQTLEAEFSAAPALDDQTRNQLGLLGSLLQKNMDGEHTPAQRAVQQAQLRQLAGSMPLQSMASGEKALLVQQGDFAALYWGDRIRTDNLDEQVRRYAALTGLPVLGIGVYLDFNLTLCAADGEQDCEAYYWFEEDEIQPGDGAELCEVLHLPETAAAPLDDAFDAEALPQLTSGLEAALGIALSPDSLLPRLGSAAAEWPGASFYKL